MGHVAAVFSVLAWAGADAAAQSPPGSGDSKAKVPRIGGEYVNVYKPAGDVRVATSRDFKAWKQHPPILTMKKGVDPESPSIVRYNGAFYLFVCGWNGIWDRKELQGAYQHVTYVYRSDNPPEFDPRNEVTTVNAHAPEVFQDEEGDWYISSAQWPRRGVSIARLVWE